MICEEDYYQIAEFTKTHLNCQKTRKTGADGKFVVFGESKKYLVTSIYMNNSEGLKSWSQSVFVNRWNL